DELARLGERVERKDVPVRRVVARRLRAAIADLAPAVHPFDLARGGTVLDPVQRGIEAGDDPVDERPSGRVVVDEHQGELGGAGRDATPSQRRWHVVTISRVARRDDTTVGKRRTGEHERHARVVPLPARGQSRRYSQPRPPGTRRRTAIEYCSPPLTHGVSSLASASASISVHGSSPSVSGAVASGQSTGGCGPTVGSATYGPTMVATTAVGVHGRSPTDSSDSWSMNPRSRSRFCASAGSTPVSSCNA